MRSSGRDADVDLARDGAMLAEEGRVAPALARAADDSGPRSSRSLRRRSQTTDGVHRLHLPPRDVCSYSHLLCTLPN